MRNRKMGLLKEKEGFEMSFAWIFAILAGAFILFIAIYATLNIVRGGQNTVNVICAKQFTILFDPMETGLASGKSTNVSLAIETRIFNKCYEAGDFGRQEFSCSQKSGMLREWPSPGGGINVNNRYVFSGKVEQSKSFSFFSKPFEMPFKVSEIIFMLSNEYCFVDAPEFIKDEIRDLGIGMIKLENCTGKETRVCFNSECDISVHGTCEGIGCESEYDWGYTKKNGKTMYYSGNLIYATIFSDPELYYCNVNRLMLRIKSLVSLYNNEQSLLSTRGCGTAISSSLLKLARVAEQADGRTASGMQNLRQEAELAEMENLKQGGCKIW